MEPSQLFASAKAGPFEVDFGDPITEIIGIIVIVLAIYAGMRIIRNLIPDKTRRP